MKKLILNTLLLLAISISGKAQVSGFCFDYQTFLKVYNVCDSGSLRTFYRNLTTDQKKVSENVKQTLSEYRFTGQLTFIRQTALSLNQTELTLLNPLYHSWFNILWVTDSAGRYKEHHVRPVRLRTEFLQSGKLTDRQVRDSADHFITNLATKKVFAGTVLIARNTRKFYEKSFGVNGDGRPDSLKQQYHLASMGKLFTTISILQLVDAKKLSLDDSVGKLMPGLKNKSLYSITIRQLMMHTSGMGDYFETPDYNPMEGKVFGPTDYLPAVEKDKPQFRPGEKFSYSNTGFLLLGLIVEKVAGLPFSEYVKRNICIPSSMINTLPGNGSGGGVSTADDLFNFAQALRKDKLLKKESAHLLSSFHENEWGFGQEYQQLGNEVITGHSGGFINVCTELNMYHETGYVVIILSNFDPPFGHFISDRIKELLIRKDNSKRASSLPPN